MKNLIRKSNLNKKLFDLTKFYSVILDVLTDTTVIIRD